MLTVLAVVVWGMIARRIWSWTDDPVSRSTGPVTANPAGASQADSVLLLNYRDPFLERSRPKPKPRPVSEPRRTAAERPAGPEIPPVKYKGMIRRGTRVYAIIVRDASPETVLRGDRIGEYRLDRISEDSVVFQKGSNRYVVKRE